MNWAIQFAVAFFTLLAVLVALFGQGLFGKWFPPKLQLAIPEATGKVTPVQFITQDGPRPQHVNDLARYYHLVVKNERRWSRATDVQVSLVQLEEVAADGDFRVTWRGDIPMEWEHQNLYSVGRTIGSPARINLCSVVRNGQLQIHPLVAAFNLPAKWPSPKRLRLTFVAKSSEVDSQSVVVTICWDGQWRDDDNEMQRHLVLDIQ